VGTAPAVLGECDGDRGRARQRTPASSPREDDHCRQYGEVRAESHRLREFVVGLADALTQERAGRGRPTRHHQVECDGDGASGGADRPDQLEVLEQHVAVVAPDPSERGAPQGEGTRVVVTGRTVQQRPSCVPSCVPRRRRLEDVLGDHEIRGP
jgi:hypothetical protein